MGLIPNSNWGYQIRAWLLAKHFPLLRLFASFKTEGILWGICKNFLERVYNFKYFPRCWPLYSIHSYSAWLWVVSPVLSYSSPDVRFANCTRCLTNLVMVAKVFGESKTWLNEAEKVVEKTKWQLESNIIPKVPNKDFISRFLLLILELPLRMNYFSSDLMSL